MYTLYFVLRGRHTRMRGLRLTNAQHSKLNCFKRGILLLLCL